MFGQSRKFLEEVT